MTDEVVTSSRVDFPLLRGTYLAQLVLPRELCKQDAKRLIELIKCWPQTPRPLTRVHCNCPSCTCPEPT